ncbi:histidine kinase dimerization/phospho-acceptor domain-containing protein [Pontiella sp.]|uniref:histidine kinase dimerization/phospho-acceptor domain-containing protein n=1 Tax=Pontiella sp. TaxID=2837462 RepID=UPI003566E843
MIANEQTAPWPKLAAILLSRLGFLWLLVLASLLLPNDDAAFYALMGVAFIVTIPYSLWLRSKLKSTEFAPLQFVIDLLLVTGLVYFTGGIRSQLTLLYPLVILSAGIVGTPKQAVEITVLAIITYILMATLLSNKMLVEYVPTGIPLLAKSTSATLLLRSLTFAAFGAASCYIAKRCILTDTQENELARTTATLLEHIPEPALLIDRDGKIVFATPAAVDLFGIELEQLKNNTFTDLLVAEAEPIPESYGKAAYFRRTGNGPLPAGYRSADLALPETALLGKDGRKNETIALSLVCFTDLSAALANANMLGRLERIHSANRIAGDLAHEIRTPLTAISASVQLLKSYEEKASAADWLPNSPRRIDRIELFDHIEDASRRMDIAIRHFVDFATFSPSDLMSIIKLDSPQENKGYMGQLKTIGRGLKNGKNTHCG